MRGGTHRASWAIEAGSARVEAGRREHAQAPAARAARPWVSGVGPGRPEVGNERRPKVGCRARWAGTTLRPMSGSPLDAHAASPQELRDRIVAERRGSPFPALSHRHGRADPARPRRCGGPRHDRAPRHQRRRPRVGRAGVTRARGARARRRRLGGHGRRPLPQRHMGQRRAADGPPAARRRRHDHARRLACRVPRAARQLGVAANGLGDRPAHRRAPHASAAPRAGRAVSAVQGLPLRDAGDEPADRGGNWC